MPEQAEIVLVCQDQRDKRLLEPALRRARIDNPIRQLLGAEAAITHFQSESAAALKPAMVIVALDLLASDSIEFLQEAREERPLVGVPLVVLTSSSLDQQLLASYSMQEIPTHQHPESTHEFDALAAYVAAAITRYSSR